jgi:hypothetical protein
MVVFSQIFVSNQANVSYCSKHQDEKDDAAEYCSFIVPIESVEPCFFIVMAVSAGAGAERFLLRVLA